MLWSNVTLLDKLPKPLLIPVATALLGLTSAHLQINRITFLGTLQLSYVKKELDTSEWKIISKVNRELLRIQAKAVVVDETNGAIGRNKKGYRSVGFQRYSSKLIAYGLATKDIQLVDLGFKVIEYAFTYQTKEGNFLDLSNRTGRSTPTSVAFFLHDVGHSLLLCNTSNWFQTAQKTANLKMRLNRLLPQVTVSLNWLLKQTAELIKSDGNGRATNRLFFDASAFYLTGKVLNHKHAIEQGEYFARLALHQQSNEGAFLEKGGFDSSYQGVSINLAILLYIYLDKESDSLKKDFLAAIHKGIHLEMKQISLKGQISTVENTRVYPGGETYFNQEKQIDYLPLVNALYYYSLISEDCNLKEVANRVLSFYTDSKRRNNSLPLKGL